MRKKMYWGIASLILIIGVVGVYFMLQPESDTEPEKKFIVPSEAENKQAKDVNQPQRSVSEVAKPPPPGASPNEHWHDGEWHDEVHHHISDTKQTTELPEAKLKRLLEEEAKWEAIFAAEAAENGKIHAQKVADYNRAKKANEVNLKAFEFIQKQQELLKAMENGKHISKEELNQMFKESKEIRQMIYETQAAKDKFYEND